MPMTRPKNPYRKGTMIHALMEGALEGEFDGKVGWEDLTAKQIAEALGTSREAISANMRRIWIETGYEVPHKRLRNRKRKAGCLNNKCSGDI